MGSIASKDLWESLNQKGLYTKSYIDFNRQFSDKESQKKLHAALKEKNLYTDNNRKFRKQFFKEKNKYNFVSPRKAKDGRDVIESIYSIDADIEYGTNKQTTKNTINDVFGETAKRLMPDHAYAGTDRGRRRLEKYSADQWKNLFKRTDSDGNVLDDGGAKYEAFKKYWETGVLNISDIEDQDFLMEFSNVISHVKAEQYQQEVIGHLESIKRTGRDRKISEATLIELEKIYTGDPADMEALANNPEALKKYIQEQSKFIQSEFDVIKKEGQGIAAEIDKYVTVQDGKFTWTGNQEDLPGFLSRAEHFQAKQDDFMNRAVQFEDSAKLLEMFQFNYDGFYRTGLHLQKVKLDAIMAITSKAPEWALRVAGGHKNERFNKAFNTVVDRKARHMDMIESLEKKMETTLPPTVKMKYADMSTIAGVSKQMLGNNSFSIITAMGYGRLLNRFGFVKKGAMTQAQVNKTKWLTRGLTGTFFLSEGSAKLTEIELAQRRAPEMIKNLKEQLAKAETFDERETLQKQINFYEKTLGTSELQKAAAFVFYGGIAAIAERLGTMKYIEDLVHINRVTKGGLVNAMKSVTTRTAYGIQVEILEETVTQLGHNLTDILLLKQDKSLIDGLDLDFFVNVGFSSLVIQGPSVGTNIYNSVLNEVSSIKDKQKSDIYKQEISVIAEQLDKLRAMPKTKQRDEAIQKFTNDINGILKKASMEATIIAANATQLSKEDLMEVFEKERQARKILKEVEIIASSNLNNARSKKKIEQLEKQLDQLYIDKDTILNKPRNELNKMLKEMGIESVEQRKAAGQYFFWKHAVQGSGSRVFTFKGENGKQEYTDFVRTQKKPKEFEGTQKQWEDSQIENYNKVGGWRIGGNIVLFEDAALAAIKAGNKIDVYAMAALAKHELQHIYDIKVGIVKDGKVVPEIIEILKNASKTMRENKVAEDVIADFEARVAMYTKNGQVNWVEVMAALSELVAAGRIKSENRSWLFDWRSVMMSVRGLVMSEQLNKTFSITDFNDVLVYLEKFDQKLRRNRIKLSTLPEDDQVQQSKINVFKDSNDALVKILKQLNVPNAEDAVKENKEDRAEFAKIWNAEWKGKDKTLSLGMQVGAAWRSYIEEAILSRRQEVPGYDLLKDDILDMVTTGIEVGENGIPYLVRSWDPSQRQLTSHIFDNLANRLNGIIQDKFPQFGKITVQAGTTTVEGKKTGVDLTTTEDVETTLKKQAAVKKAKKKAQKEQTFRKDIGITETMVNEFKEEVANLLKDPKLGAVNEFQFYQNFRDKIIKTKLFQKMSTHIGTTNSPEFKQFLKDRRLKYIKNAPTSDLVQIEKMVKGKKVLTTFKHRATTKDMIDKAIDLGLLKSFEVKTDKQGPAIYEKQDVNEDDFVNLFFGKRGRRESLIKNIVNMVAMDAIGEVYRKNKDVQEALKTNNAHTKNVMGELKARIDRNLGVDFSIIMNADQLKILENGLPNFTKSYLQTGSVIDAFRATFPDNLLNLTPKKEKALILDLKRLIHEFEIIDQAYRKIDPKVKFNLKDYLAAKSIPADYLKSLKTSKGLPTDGANFGDVKQIIASREGLIEIRNAFIDKYGEKLGLEKFDKVFRGLISQSQLGSTNIMMKTISTVNRKTSTIQKKINNILESYDKKGFLTEEQEKALLKYIQNEKYKLRSTKGLINDSKDYIKNFIKGKKPKYKLKRLKASDIRNLSLKEAIKKYPEFKKAANEEIDLFIETLDIMKELEKTGVDFTGNETVMIIASLLDSTNSPLFAMSSFRFAFVGKNNKLYEGDIEYEHMITRSVIALLALEYQKGNLTKKDFKALMQNTHVSNLPRVLNDVVNNAKLKANMSGVFDINKLIAGKIEAILDRYVSAETLLSQSKDGRTFGRVMKDLGLKLVDLETGKTVKRFDTFVKHSEKVNNNVGDFSLINNAKENSRINRPRKGMSVWDFDDTIARSKSMVLYTSPDGTKGSLTAEQFASDGAALLEQGYKFDFSEFKKVVKGEKGPFFQKFVDRIKKFGVKDNFILTARPVESAPAIRAFLKSLGLDIPLKNIKALADSTASAKALWIADKIGNEAYNDIYFADDALQNVEAVKNMMDQMDVKSKVQQAKGDFSKIMGEEFNKILEESKDIPADEVFDKVRAHKRGAKKGIYQFFLPPSAEDFAGLLYYFLGKGKQGEKHFEFFKKALIIPLNRAYRELNAAKQTIADDWKSLRAQFPDVNDVLFKNITDSEFTFSDAIRVYLWDKAGYDIPGISKQNINSLVDFITTDADLKAFADLLGRVSKRPEGYVPPGEYWITEDIRDDLLNATNKIGRKEFLAEFLQNVEVIFSEENLNKIEAVYGSNFREALEDMLYRIENGTNRNFGKNRLVNEFMNWVNGSIGATMFVNVRSAVLQTISWVNFINWTDNNPIKAMEAMANPKQFWTDFTMIFNSNMLKQRRKGLQTDINAAELAGYVRKSKSPVRAAVNWLLSKGFLPTQFADSFAIALGGASMYRNRVKTYLNQGMSKQEAEQKAFLDFAEIAEETQQSARPDKISQQQASVLGRLILAFQNTPMQYMRLTKKAILDLKNGRGDAKTNISKIIYYTFVQNVIFYSLQQALFALVLGNNDDDEFAKTKKLRVVNGMSDTVLRGMGIGGAIVSTIKNMAIKLAEQKQRGSWSRQEDGFIIEALNLSPPIGIKARKLSIFQREIYKNSDQMFRSPMLDIENPTWKAFGNLVEATTNVPLARTHKKISNISEAFNAEHEAWQRIALLLGWSQWDVGIQTPYRAGPQPRRSKNTNWR